MPRLAAPASILGVLTAVTVALVLVSSHAGASADEPRTAAKRCAGGQLRLEVWRRSVCVRAPRRREDEADAITRAVERLPRPYRNSAPHAVTDLTAAYLSAINARSVPGFEKLAEEGRAAGWDVDISIGGSSVDDDSVGSAGEGDVKLSYTGADPTFAGFSVSQGYGQRRAVKRCPTVRGDVRGSVGSDFSLRIAADRPGTSGSLDVEMKLTLDAEGHVGEDARLRDFDARVLLVARLSGTERNPATGAVVEHPARLYRLLYDHRGIDPRNSTHEQVRRAAIAGQLDARGWGPRGRLGASGFERDLWTLLLGLGDSATGHAADTLLQAENVWYDRMDCLELDLRARPKEPKPRRVARVTVTAKSPGKGGPVSGLRGTYDAHTSRGSSVSPERIDGGPRVEFRFRKAARRVTVIPALRVLLTSRAGRARGGLQFGSPYGVYRGRGTGNLCIRFEADGDRLRYLRVEGAPDCAHRYECVGRLARSAPGWMSRNVPLDTNERFSIAFDQTVRPPRPGPPPRRIATTITGRIDGDRASGIFRTLFEAGSDDRCDSGILSWTARRVR